jgi:hypothetical protein
MRNELKRWSTNIGDEGFDSIIRWGLRDLLPNMAMPRPCAGESYGHCQDETFFSSAEDATALRRVGVTLMASLPTD